jgi:hypothetical protein
MKYNIEILKWIDITSYDHKDPLKNKPESIYFLQVGIVIGKCKLEDGGDVLRVANPISESIEDMNECDYFDIPIKNIVYRKKIGLIILRNDTFVFQGSGVKNEKRSNKG